MEALRSPETLLLTRATRRNIPEDGILHRHRLENLKSYMVLISLGGYVYPSTTLRLEGLSQLKNQ
jgi:hypothetical protein